jgi:putative DNA methylase
VTSMQNIKTPKKLIEVALPLDDINNAAGKEKAIRQGPFRQRER